MKRSLSHIYFQSVTPIILVILLAFIYGSKVSAKTFAYIVADARDGKILNSHNSKQIIHPASLTKMMTLYLAFMQSVMVGLLDQKQSLAKMLQWSSIKILVQAGQRFQLVFN